MRWAALSLRWRVALAAAFCAAVGVVVSGTLLSADIGRDGRAAVDAALGRRMVELRQTVSRSYSALSTPGGAPGVRFKALASLRSVALPNLLGGSGSFSRITDGSGAVLVSQGDNPPRDSRTRGHSGLTDVSIRGGPWRVLTATTGGGFVLQVASTLGPVEARVRHTRVLVLELGLLAAVLTAVGSATWSSMALRPLSRLRRAAESVSTTADLGQRLPGNRGTDETEALAASLNRMLERLQSSAAMTEAALGATRQFAADVGHELRTPLTSVRATLDTLRRRPDLPTEDRQAALEELSAESLRVIHLLDGLQTLARGDAGASLPREQLDLADVLDAAIHAARARHPQHSIDLTDQVDHAVVTGWPDGIRAILDNLLENAACHGGHLVTAGVVCATGTVSVVVEDDGPGVPELDRGRIFKRFARGEAAHAGGCGLGLAIVAQQAKLHGGEAHVGDSDMGGARFTIVLPLARDGDS